MSLAENMTNDDMTMKLKDNQQNCLEVVTTEIIYC